LCTPTKVGHLSRQMQTARKMASSIDTMPSADFRTTLDIGQLIPALAVAQLGVAAEVPVGVAELAFDHGDALEVVADIEFVGHAHAAVDLHGVLADELAGLADLHFRAGGGELAG